MNRVEKKTFYCPECRKYDVRGIHDKKMREALERKYGKEEVWRTKK